MNLDKQVSSPLFITSFRNFIIARFSFLVALQMVNTAIAWHLYELTHNKLSLGLLGLSEVIPAISFALYAGHIIDKSDKRTLLFNNMCFYLLAIILLGATVSDKSKMLLGPLTTEWIIYGLIFFTGIFRAFTGPTQQSMVAQLVPKERLVSAISWSSTAWQSASVIGPILAGILIAEVGLMITFCVAIVIVIIAAVLVYSIERLPISNMNQQQRTWESVKEGIRYVWKTKPLLNALSLDLFAVFFGGATALLPVYAKDILHVDATGMGILRAAQGIGSIIMLLWITRHPLKSNQGRIMLQCVAWFGIMMIVFAISKNFWLSFVALFLAGAFDSISMVVRSTILQMFVPDEMRGRVSSVNSMFINSSNELGYFESGVAAQLMGTAPSVVFGGCMTLLIVGYAWTKAPQLRKMVY